jgi:hypothetical protein
MARWRRLPIFPTSSSGNKLIKRVPTRVVRMVAGQLFLVIGLWFSSKLQGFYDWRRHCWWSIRAETHSRTTHCSMPIVTAHNLHSIEMGHSATSIAIVVGERLGLGLAGHIRNSYRQPMADCSLLI